MCAGGMEVLFPYTAIPGAGGTEDCVPATPDVDPL